MSFPGSPRPCDDINRPNHATTVRHCSTVNVNDAAPIGLEHPAIRPAVWLYDTVVGKPDKRPDKRRGESAATSGTSSQSSTKPLAKGVFAFEGDWETDLRNLWSIEPILRTLEVVGELKCIRRNVATMPELEHYVGKWLQKRYADYEVGYFGFHGAPGSLWFDDRRGVSLEDLEAMIGKGKEKAKGRVIHFGSCSVMRLSETRLRKFQANTEARAVIGYRRDVTSDLDWAAFEILLLGALSRYRQTGAPARHLRNNYGHLCDKLGFVYIY